MTPKTCFLFLDKSNQVNYSTSERFLNPQELGNILIVIYPFQIEFHRWDNNKLAKNIKDVPFFYWIELKFNCCNYQVWSSVGIEWCLKTSMHLIQSYHSFPS